jgi:hypothetical protein
MDRLGEITAPTLVIAGRDDFLFPPEHQALLATRIPEARLRIVERAGHSPHAEQPGIVLRAVADFLAEPSGVDRVQRDAASVNAAGHARLQVPLLDGVHAAVIPSVIGVRARERVEVLDRAVGHELDAAAHLEEAGRVARVHDEEADAVIGQ